MVTLLDWHVDTFGQTGRHNRTDVAKYLDRRIDKFGQMP